MLIDLLTYVCLDKTALISALGFIKKLSQIKQLLVFAVFLATTWHAGGQRFKSAWLHLFFLVILGVLKSIFVKT